MGYVLGELVTLTNSLKLVIINARILLNSELASEENATALSSGPFKSLTWLANKLAEQGLHPKTGDYVMTDSHTKQFTLQSCDTTSAEF